MTIITGTTGAYTAKGAYKYGILIFTIFNALSTLSSLMSDYLPAYIESDNLDASSGPGNASIIIDESPHLAYDESAARFQEIELIKLLGGGDVNYAFTARYNNETVVAKIATDKCIFQMDWEIDIFHELNSPPSIPNIPKLKLAIRSIPNPFTDATYLEGLGLSSKVANRFILKRRISVMVMGHLQGRRQPKSIREIRRLMKSLLETIRFAHSRNIIHGDIHGQNYFWDGKRASIFDWNGAFRYEKDKNLIHYPNTAKHLYPPEAWDNKTAVHASVYAFDVYTIGKRLKKLLNKTGVRELKSEDTDRDDKLMALNLVEYLMTPDPYQRPDTNLALSHPFFL